MIQQNRVSNQEQADVEIARLLGIMASAPFDGLAREHSRKPEEFYRLVDQYCPRLKGRADLFARTRRQGWRAWGHETEKFEAAA